MKRCAAVVAACLALGACADQAEQEMKSAASWSATALAVARYWVQGDLPDAYAKRALEKASEELAKGPLPDASEPVNELIEAIGKHDQDAARRLIAELERR
jgi:uncharacterized protein YciW